MVKSRIYLGIFLIIVIELFLAKYSSIGLLLIGLIIGLSSEKVLEGAYAAGASGFWGILICDILFIINIKFLGLSLQPILGGFNGFTVSGNKSYLPIFYALLSETISIAIAGAIGAIIRKVIG